MTNKKLLQIAGLVVAAIWVFCISLFVAVKRIEKTPGQTNAVLTTASSGSAVGTSTVPSATTQSNENSPKYTIGGNHVSTNVSVGDPDWYVAESQSKKASEAASIAAEIRDSSIAKAENDVPKEKKDIINAYVDAVNRLKDTKDFSLTKEENLNVEIDNITGGSIVENIASSLISNNTNAVPASYRFSSGIDSSSGKTPTAVIAPLNTSASLDKSIVTSATATSTGGGAYTLKLVLGEATQTLESPANGYSTAMEVINLDSLGLPGNMSVSSMSITYDESVIEASIDKDGRITSIKHELTVSHAEGEGKYLLVPVSVALHGSFKSSYTVTY